MRWINQVAVVASLFALGAFAQPMGPGMGAGPMHLGIPPHLAAKLGLSAEVTKQAREASLDANEQLITLEAELKRAQLDLDRALLDPKADEGKVLQKLEVISKAELGVRKNRVGLMFRLRKLIGSEAWEKLQAEMPGMGLHGGMMGSCMMGGGTMGGMMGPGMMNGGPGMMHPGMNGPRPPQTP